MLNTNMNLLAVSKQNTPAQTNIIQLMNAKPTRHNYVNHLAFQGKKDEKARYNPSHNIIRLAKSVTLPGTDRVVNLLEGKYLDKPAQKAIKTISSDIVQGKSVRKVFKPIDETERWHIDNPKAWMITSETETFMKTGGLATVAFDLPNAFTKANEGNNEREMPIITPLYTADKGNKIATIVPITGEKNKYKYIGAMGKSIELTKVKTLDVPMYSKNAKKMVKQKADVLVGKMDGIKYIFISNDKHFNVNPHETNPSVKQGPYVLSENGVDEVERMAFLSKATVELAKSAKEEPIEDVAAPNVLVANDWHAGAVSALTKYVAPIMGDKGDMSKDTANYLKDMPVVNIVHNLDYQGADNKNTEKLLNSVLGEYAKPIVLNADSAVKEGRVQNSMIVGKTYNQANMNVNAADVVIPVSDNYANEILKTSILGKHFIPVLKERAEYDTYVGITNGYTKSLLAPSKEVINGINNGLGLDGENAFKMYNENDLSNRIHNKKALVSLVQHLGDKATATINKKKAENPNATINSAEVMPNVSLYKPEESDLNDIDLEKTPILTTVGRMVDQKGFDIMAKSLQKSLAETPEGQEKPAFIMLASGDKETAQKVRDMKDNLAKTNPETARRVIIFEGFNKNLGAAIQTAGDMFIIPSRFEPCGLTQMEAMAKGNVPVAMSTGGLVSTIKDGEDGFLSPVAYAERRNRNKDTGLMETIAQEEVFRKDGYTEEIPKNNVDALSVTLNKALNTFYNNPDRFKRMSKNAMHRDFSWDKGGALDKYMQIFQHGKILPYKPKPPKIEGEFSKAA